MELVFFQHKVTKTRRCTKSQQTQTILSVFESFKLSVRKIKKRKNCLYNS